MIDNYDWSSFYAALCQHGPNLLMGIDEELREMIGVVAMSTDMFWSEELQQRLARGAADGELREGVLSALELWRQNVLETLEIEFAIEPDRISVNLDATSPLIEELVDAARPK